MVLAILFIVGILLIIFATHIGLAVSYNYSNIVDTNEYILYADNTIHGIQILGAIMSLLSGVYAISCCKRTK